MATAFTFGCHANGPRTVGQLPPSQIHHVCVKHPSRWIKNIKVRQKCTSKKLSLLYSLA